MRVNQDRLGRFLMWLAAVLAVLNLAVVAWAYSA